MEQLILHDTPTVCGWPNSARGELFAVARRDIAVARLNLASMTHVRGSAGRPSGGL